MIRNIDAWIGKTLFHPIIIAICQMRGWSQFQFASMMYILTNRACMVTWDSTLMACVHGFYTMIGIVHFVMIGDTPRDDNIGVRILMLILLSFVIWAFIIGATESLLPFAIMAIGFLFHQYALTIKTIPPREQEFNVKAENR